VAQTPLGDAFTYQGQLKKAGLPYNGTATISLSLWDAPVGGNQVGATSVQLDVPVTQGVFTVTPDFGAVFTGSARWMSIQVETPGDAAPTDLDPRQPLTAAPYALYAKNAPSGGGGGGSQWISNGPDLTYAAGGVGFLGASSPFAAGKGVFIEGGNATAGNIFAFNYDTFKPLTLSLNAPGGSVGIGTSAPAAKLDVLQTVGLGIRSTVAGSLFQPNNAAVYAIGNTGTGISGTSAIGVLAGSTDDRAIAGFSTNNFGVSGDCTSAKSYGILGTPSEGVKGVAQTAGTFGGVFVNTAGGVALKADGLAQVRTLQILGADLAESFPVAQAGIEPGTVLMIDGDADGRLRVADEAYSRRVAGVVSGANGLDAAVILKGKSYEGEGHAAVALSGRVWVRCDATTAPIHTGDLLTTSAMAGHAMVVSDRDRAFGAILGKAMTSLETGTGLVLVLVNLQ
jgi:hypothetical protein